MCGKVAFKQIMGHRGKNTTFEQQQLVVFHHSKGKSCQQIASMLKMKKTTVWNIIEGSEVKIEP